MRNHIWQLSWTTAILMAAGLCLATAARADWTEDFNGSFDQFWQFGAQDGDTNTFLGGQIINDQLVLTADASPSEGGVGTAFGLVVTQSFSDVRMTGVINPANDENINDTVGLLIRGNTVNQTFYLAEVNYNSAELIIYRNNPAVSGGNSNLATASIPGLQFSESLYVEIEAIGDNLEVWAYEDATKANLRATTSFVDDSAAALTSGISGVLVNENFASLPMLGIWDDLSSTAIVSASPGDIDGDGDVDGDDFLQIQRGFGTSTTQQDLTDWQSNYGNGSLAAVTAVPEPTTLSLTMGALLVGVCRRRGK